MATSLFGCIKQEENRRDRIDFPTASRDIEESIKRINTLMSKAPATEVSNYFFDDEGNIHINNKKLGKPGEFKSDTVAVLRNLTHPEKQDLITNALFLKDNYISGAIYDGLFKTWRYSYRELEDKSFNLYRDIFYKSIEVPMQDITQAHEVLDSTGNLVLIKGKR